MRSKIHVANENECYFALLSFSQRMAYSALSYMNKGTRRSVVADYVLEAVRARSLAELGLVTSVVLHREHTYPIEIYPTPCCEFAESSSAYWGSGGHPKSTSSPSRRLSTATHLARRICRTHHDIVHRNDWTKAGMFRSNAPQVPEDLVKQRRRSLYLV